MLSVSDLFCFLACLFTATIFVLCFNYLTNSKLKLNFKSILVVLLTGVAIFLNTQYAQTTNFFLKTIASLFILTTQNLIIFNAPTSKTFIISFGLFLISIMVEGILGIMVSLVFPIFSFSITRLNAYATIIFSVVVYLILYLLIVKTKISGLLVKIQKKIKIENTDYLFIISVFLLINIAASYGILKIDAEDEHYVIVFILILAFIFFVFKLFELMYSSKLINVKNIELERQQKLYDVTFQKYRELKHNLVSQLIAVQSLANSDTQKLIQEKLDLYDNQAKIMQILNKAPRGIREVLYEKLAFVEEKITLFIDSDADENVVKKIRPRYYNALIESFCILVDNAVEAIAESEDANALLYLYIKETKAELTIQILNTFSNEINVENLGNYNYSTKNRNSGVGLYSINKNRRVKLKSIISNNKITFILTVPKKNATF